VRSSVTRAQILWIDEFRVHAPCTSDGAELLFQVISTRYERGSIIITTNVAFKDWTRIFAGDAT
jgi:DNA replication protein DnaC